MKKNFEKCKYCNLFGRASDTPLMVEKDCLYHFEPDFDKNGNCIDEPPCEREGKRSAWPDAQELPPEPSMEDLNRNLDE